MSKIKDSDFHAFPTSSVDGFTQHGMTLRDYFAGQALAGEFAAQGEELGVVTNNIPDDWMLARASMLYRMADAMLAARTASPTGEAE